MLDMLLEVASGYDPLAQQAEERLQQSMIANMIPRSAARGYAGRSRLITHPRKISHTASTIQNRHSIKAP